MDVVWDPLDEVGGVLVLDVADLVLDFLHGDLAAVDGGAGEVTTVAEVGSGHHVLGVEDLLGELRNGDGAEAEDAPRLVRGAKPTMKKWRRGNGTMLTASLRRSAVELAGETQTSGDARHDGGDEVVEVTVAGVVELQGAHADVRKM